jgi:hypothetical protein
MSNTIYAMTLTSVRAAIQSYLDDDGTRWSVGTTANVLDMSKDVDRAIKFGMFQAVRFYVKAAEIRCA